MKSHEESIREEVVNAAVDALKLRIIELESALQAADAGRNYANELLTEQSQRVRELQEKIQEMAKEHVEFVLISHSAVCGERDSLKDELAALQKRIDDAPVVAWLHEVRQDSDVITHQVKHLWGRVPAVGKEARYTIPLISKEDLQPLDALSETSEKLGGYEP